MGSAWPTAGKGSAIRPRRRRKLSHKMKLLVISTLFVIFALDINQVLGKDYSKQKEKYSAKDKLGKWAGSKNKKADPGIPEKPQKKKTSLKVNTYKTQDEEERQRICMSYAEDSMSDFLLKFGTVTKLIEDVSEFEMKLKAAEESFAPWRKRRLWKANRGLTGDKYLDDHLFPSPTTYSGRLGNFRQRPVIKHNHLSEKRKRKKVKSERSDAKYVHACYGYNYLSSMGALANDPSTPSSGTKVPDLDLFRESLMDLGDMNLSDSLIQLADGCKEKNNRQDKVCPALYQTKPESRSTPEDDASVSPHPDNCPYSCLSHNDCAEREICCPTQCGGASCYNPGLRAKYRSADGVSVPGAADKSKKRKKFDASRKCAMADGFVQCLYDGIGKRICE